MKNAKAIIQKKVDDFEALCDLLKKNTGYLVKFTEFLVYENIEIDLIRESYDRILALRRDGSRIKISDIKNFEDLEDTLRESEEEIKFKRVYNRFPREQKNIVDNSGYHMQAMRRNMILAYNSPNLNNFIAKISSLKEQRELISGLRMLNESIDNSMKTIRSTKFKNGSSIIYDSDNILIINVKTRDDLAMIASDCSWCILRPSYFNDYLKKGYQMVVFNYNLSEYDADFKTGLTLNLVGGYSTSHDISDEYNKEYIENIFSEYNITGAKLIDNLKDVYTGMRVDKIKSISAATQYIKCVDLETVYKNREVLFKNIYKPSKSPNYRWSDTTYDRFVFLERMICILSTKYNKIEHYIDSPLLYNHLNEFYKNYYNIFFVEKPFIRSYSNIIDIYLSETPLYKIKNEISNVIGYVSDDIYNIDLYDKTRKREDIPSVRKLHDFIVENKIELVDIEAKYNFFRMELYLKGVFTLDSDIIEYIKAEEPLMEQVLYPMELTPQNYKDNFNPVVKDYVFDIDFYTIKWRDRMVIDGLYNKVCIEMDRNLVLNLEGIPTSDPIVYSPLFDKIVGSNTHLTEFEFNKLKIIIKK